MDFYLSTKGDDAFDGTAPDRAWRSVARAGRAAYSPGDRLLLQRGDRWCEPLELRGVQGAPGRPVVIGAYGEGPLPALRRTGAKGEICLLLEDCSHVEVRDLDLAEACQGLVIHLTAPQRDLSVTGCRFSRIQGLSYKGAEIDGRFFVSSAGIMVSGAWGKEPLLDGLTIRDCRSSDDCNALWWVASMTDEQLHGDSGVYAVRNFRASDCLCEGGCFGWWIFGVLGGTIERVVATKNGISEFWAGNTAAGIEHCRDIEVTDCEFSYCNRPVFNPDGCGLDLEGGGNCGIAVRNCRMALNHGAGLMLYDKGGGNRDVRIEDCNFDQNCANQLKPGGFEVVVLGHHEGLTLSGNKFRPRPGIAALMNGNGTVTRDNRTVTYELRPQTEVF